MIHKKPIARSKNKKVRNARTSKYDGITFRSALEGKCYKLLCREGFEFKYEPETITLWKGTKPSKARVYAPKKTGRGRCERHITEQAGKLRDITYTPDFVITRKTATASYKIYLEVKGMENDVYPLKKKMFIKHLNERKDEYTYLFMEPHSLYQIEECIEIIKNLE